MPHSTKTRTRQASKSRRQNSPPFASSEPNSMATGTIRYCPEYRMSLGTQNWKDYFATMPQKEAPLTAAEKVLALYGDAWVWIAFVPTWRLVAAFVVGKRDQEHANDLLKR